jgi:hypothetical protein
MTQPLMPLATAVWLVENTTLTFEQIAEFCRLHPLEVQAIADGEVAQGMKGLDPVASGQLDPEELERCLKDPKAKLTLKPQRKEFPLGKARRGRYTPVSKRQDKPDAILYLIRRHPTLTDAQISRLLGTTKPTIKAVREGTHKSASALAPRDPVALGLCRRDELERELERASAQAEAATPRAAPPEPPPADPAGEAPAQEAAEAVNAGEGAG